MRALEAIEQLERFDPEAEVVVATVIGTRRVKDIGRRERPDLGVHPIIYLDGTEEV
jgi:hypothetical protein